MTLLLSSLIFGCSTPSEAAQQVEVGAPAPDFTLTDLDGKSWTLSALKGKTVVLEWFNPGCPFVVAAHEGPGPLADLAGKQPDQVVWLAVNSGAPGKQGADPAENREATQKWNMGHPVLMDPTGEVGKTYGASNTPQMVVVDAKGTLAYYGALDNAPLNEVKGGESRIDYAANAIAAVVKGEKPEPARTKPYGCSVKY
ncbi:MAG: redoxin family protein [Myxococcales bacterium]|nr:redoxin family protein [Myxococcales bacterium]MCB9692229.1 redoxin family protein [Alphaproteobacteria bacterium]